MNGTLSLTFKRLEAPKNTKNGAWKTEQKAKKEAKKGQIAYKFSIKTRRRLLCKRSQYAIFLLPLTILANYGYLGISCQTLRR